MSYAGVQCWWADRLDEAAIKLRRYASSESANPTCPGPFGYHNSESDQVDRVDVEWSGEGWAKTWRIVDWPKPSREDPRWPTSCECGYVFADEDEWSVMSDLIYRRLDNGEDVLLIGKNGSRGSGPPGMLFDMSWYPNSTAGSDGIVLGAVCPNGAMWCVDAPSRSGGGWSRTGEAKADPPTVTARPSIVADDYHGFLQNGHFTDG